MSSRLKQLINLESPVIFYGDDAEAKAKEMLQEIVPAKDIENHPDISILQPEGKSDLYSMASISKFIEDVDLPPYQSPYKVYLLLRADNMLPVHANALLKTLEEKKPFTVIFLTSGNLRSLLPTILSRCQKVYSGKENAGENQYPLIEEAIELAKQNEYSALIHKIEQIEKEGIAPDEIFSSLLKHQAVTLELVEKAQDALERNIKLKVVLEYLLMGGSS